MNATLTERKELLKEIKTNIEKDLKKSIEGVDIIDVLGSLVSPFAGIDCISLHSGCEDTNDRVLEALIAFFVKEENLKQLPEYIQTRVIETLSSCHTLMQRMSEIDKKIDNSLFFDASNLYNFKRYDPNHNKIKEYKNWYGDDTY